MAPQLPAVEVTMQIVSLHCIASVWMVRLLLATFKQAIHHHDSPGGVTLRNSSLSRRFAELGIGRRLYTSKRTRACLHSMDDSGVRLRREKIERRLPNISILQQKYEHKNMQYIRLAWGLVEWNFNVSSLVAIIDVTISSRCLNGWPNSTSLTGTAYERLES